MKQVKKIRLEAGPVPLYHQMEQDLRDRILRGEFEPGSTLPTEEELGSAYGVSRITVRRALDNLLAQRLVLRRRGVGTFVAPNAGSVQSVRLVGYLDDTLAYVRELTYQQVSRSTLEPGPLVGAALQVGAGQRVVRIQMLVQTGDEPFAYTHFYFPETVGELVHEKDIVDGVPILRIVEHKLQQRIHRGEQVVRPALADADVARRLNIPMRTPILKVYRTYYVADGTPVEMAVVHYHPDRYDFRVDLVTHPGAAAQGSLAVPGTPMPRPAPAPVSAATRTAIGATRRRIAREGRRVTEATTKPK